MSQERLMTILLGPHVSEKTTRTAEKHNQVAFRVRKDADKAEIRRVRNHARDISSVRRVVNYVRLKDDPRRRRVK